MSSSICLECANDPEREDCKYKCREPMPAKPLPQRPSPLATKKEWKRYQSQLQELDDA